MTHRIGVRFSEDALYRFNLMTSDLQGVDQPGHSGSLTLGTHREEERRSTSPPRARGDTLDQQGARPSLLPVTTNPDDRDRDAPSTRSIVAFLF